MVRIWPGAANRAHAMPIYTFYPCRADGSSTTFEAFELDGDQDARVRASELLRQHPTCSFVRIWHGDRQIDEQPQPVREDAR